MVENMPGREEEYKPSEMEGGSTYTGEAGRQSHRPPPKSNFVVIIFVIVVAFSVYQLLNYFFGKEAPKKEVEEETVIEAIEPEPMEEITPVPVLEVPEAQKEEVVPEQHTDITQQAVSSNKAKIGEIETSLESIKHQLNEMSENVTTLNRSLLQIGKAVNSQQEELENIRKLKLSEKPIARETYYVQAIVPGRAWLGRKSGGTTTVSVGDHVPGYGIIEHIDETRGFIITSSGDVMRYHPQDE